MMDPVKRQLVSAISVSMIGFQGGMVLGYPGVVLAQWQLPESKVRLTLSESSWFASISQLVRIPGSFIGGVAIEALGPRKMILTFLPLLSLSWVAIVYTVHIPSLLLLARSVQALLYSILCVAGCLFPCEVAEHSLRGFLGAFIHVQFSLGFLATYIVGGLVTLEYFGPVSMLISIIPCFIGTWMAPESAHWLVRRGRLDEATKELRKIRRIDADVAKEIAIASERGAYEAQYSLLQRIESLSQIRYFLPVLLVILCLVLKEATGQIAVVLFAVQIFRKVGPGITPFWGSILISSTRLCFNFLSCLLLNKISTKILIVPCAFFGSISMLLMWLYFSFESFFVKQNLEWLPVIFLLSYVICYGFGIGPPSWLLTAELLPASVVNIGSGIAHAAFNTTQFLVASSFISVETSKDSSVSFFVYSIGCLAFDIFVLVVLPETIDKSTIEIEDYWAKKEEKFKGILRINSISEERRGNRITLSNIPRRSRALSFGNFADIILSNPIDFETTYKNKTKGNPLL